MTRVALPPRGAANPALCTRAAMHATTRGETPSAEGATDVTAPSSPRRAMT